VFIKALLVLDYVYWPIRSVPARRWRFIVFLRKEVRNGASRIEKVFLAGCAMDAADGFEHGVCMTGSVNLHEVFLHLIGANSRSVSVSLGRSGAGATDRLRC